MENKEKGAEGECCDSKESCGGGSCGGCGSCGGRRCCAGKAALVLVLLLIGGIIGFSMGRCHRSMGMCPMPMGSTMMAPAK